MHILILGGTTEANELAALLALRPDIPATLSLAGRTQNPVLPPIAHRIGGFGGVDGLVRWIREHNITAIIDATHPFASIMPFHTAQAAHECGIPLIGLTRPEWKPESNDRWIEVASHNESINLLGSIPQRIFLTVGRLEIDAYAIAPQHFYLARTIDPVSPNLLPNAHWLNARGPFSLASEQSLLREHAIDTVVTKNSGGEATKAKLIAARNLGLPVILIARPPKPEVEKVTSGHAAMEWILHIHSVS